MGTFELEGPFAPSLAGDGGAGTMANAADDSTGTGSAVGQCRGDQFVAASGLGSSPIICGTNMGQHMVLDTDGSMCVNAMFTFSAGGNTQRQYRIHIVQFGEFNDMGGPRGCLQYYTGEMGQVNSFNWNGIGTSVHLANQNYDVCVRERADACRICWAPIAPAIAGSHGSFAAAKLGAFGVSNAASANGAPMAGRDADCDGQDHVTILGGNPAATNLIDNMIAAGEDGFDAFCGRYFNTVNTAAMAVSRVDATICSVTTPFRLGVRFDGSEVVGAAMARAFAMESANELSAMMALAGGAGLPNAPLGVQGFSLGFRQTGCA